MLLPLFECDRLPVRIDSLRDVAKALDSFGNFEKGPELRGAQHLAVNHVANAMLGEERLPDIRLQLLHAE
jgi:hypothetical protein